MTIRNIKLLVLVLIVVYASLCHAQFTNYNLPDCVRGFRFDVASGTIAQQRDSFNTLLAAGSTPPYDNRYAPGQSGNGCNLWHIMYWVDGPSAASLQVDFANSSGGQPGSFTIWPSANVVGATLPITTVTGVGTEVSMFGNPAWVRVFLNSATGTGAVYGVLFGWRPQGTNDTTSGVSQVKVTNLPTTVATGNGAANASTVRVALSTDSAGPVFVSNLPSTVSTNSNTADASTIRVVPATNQPFPVLNGVPANSNAAGGFQDAAGLARPGAVDIFPSSNASNAIAPITSTTTESSHILKATAGNLYGACVTTGATAGFMMVFNATSAPVDGAVTPVEWLQIAANQTACLSYGSGPPNSYATGITVVFSSTGPFTKTASATAAFVGRVQ